MRTVTGMGAAAIAMLVGSGASAQRPQPVPDPGSLIRTIAAQPLRYGGDLDGGLLDLPEIGSRPVHLAMGLETPAPDGSLHGTAILFDGERHLIAEGRVEGMMRPEPGIASAPCALKLELDGVALPAGAAAASIRPAGDVLLAGICTLSTLAGEIQPRSLRPALLGRLISWWGDENNAGRFWLTADSFDPPPAPLPPF